MKFIEHNDSLPAGALPLANSDDVLAQAQAVHASAAVVLNFPKWTDGRAYSQAVLLRGRLKYTGAIVATGDVVGDMAPLLRRCGFTLAQLREGQLVATAQRALGFFQDHYQVTLAERQGAKAVEAA